MHKLKIDMHQKPVYFIYDGECPMCSNAAAAYRIKEKFGALHLVNARDIAGDHPIMKEINARGLDLDAGMVIMHEGEYYHGAQALQFMTMLSAPKNVFNVVLKSFFWSRCFARLIYPFMRGTRNLLLWFKNAEPIDNLKVKEK